MAAITAGVMMVRAMSIVITTTTTTTITITAEAIGQWAMGLRPRPLRLSKRVCWALRESSLTLSQ